jgi:hypothetical protein
MSALPPLLLAFCRTPVAIGKAIPAGVEMTGRGYRRAPVGTLVRRFWADPSLWVNPIVITWPLALAAWGPATVLALVGLDGIVVTSCGLPGGFTVQAGDQPRVWLQRLVVGGVGPNTSRPFGVGPFGRSLFSGYPAAGVIWSMFAVVDFEWARTRTSCAPWTSAPPVVAGGCCP